MHTQMNSNEKLVFNLAQCRCSLSHCSAAANTQSCAFQHTAKASGEQTWCWVTTNLPVDFFFGRSWLINLDEVRLEHFPQLPGWTYLHALHSRRVNCSQNPTMSLLVRPEIEPRRRRYSRSVTAALRRCFPWSGRRTLGPRAATRLVTRPLANQRAAFLNRRPITRGIFVWGGDEGVCLLWAINLFVSGRPAAISARFNPQR